MEEWKVGDWLEVIDFDEVECSNFISKKSKYEVVHVEEDGTPQVVDDEGDTMVFLLNELDYIRKVESPLVEPKIDDSRLIEILTEVNEQLTEENEFKDKRIKLLEEELLAAKTRYLKLATQFDVKKFKDEN